MRRAIGHLARGLVVVGILAAVSYSGATPAAADGPIVTGGGASFPGLLISQWVADVGRAPYNLKVNYSSTGSGFGRERYTSGALDFGQSDIPFLDDELSTVKKTPRGNFVYVPVAAGALAFMFNLQGNDGNRITNIKLTPRDVCRIFTVPNIKWNDAEIARNNPGLPARDIRPIVRDDRAGTSYVLSEFCIARAPDVWNQFKATIGGGAFGQDKYLGLGQPISAWPRGFGRVAAGFASDGIANAVSNPATGKDTITYIETGYTKVKGLPAATVQNPAGVFVPPNPPNSTQALGYASPNGDGTFKLRYDGPDPKAYFPSTYSYTIAQTTGFDPAKGKVLAGYLNYAVCKGQQRAEPLLYSRLSTQLVDIALDATARIPGAPPRPATATCGAPPPPTLNNAPAAAKAGAAGAGAGAAGAGAGAAGASGAGGAADPAAAAAAAAADQAAAAAAADGSAAGTDGASAEVAGESINAAAGTKGAAGSGSTSGPENSDVLFTLLLGAGLVAFGTFVSKGTRASMGKQ